jgi:hypothetical protein
MSFTVFGSSAFLKKKVHSLSESPHRFVSSIGSVGGDQDGVLMMQEGVLMMQEGVAIDTLLRPNKQAASSKQQAASSKSTCYSL